MNRRQFLLGATATATAVASVPFVCPGSEERWLLKRFGPPKNVSSVNAAFQGGYISGPTVNGEPTGVTVVRRDGEPEAHVKPGEFYPIQQGDQIAFLLNNPDFALAR